MMTPCYFDSWPFGPSNNMTMWQFWILFSGLAPVIFTVFLAGVAIGMALLSWRLGGRRG